MFNSKWNESCKKYSWLRPIFIRFEKHWVREIAQHRHGAWTYDRRSTSHYLFLSQLIAKNSAHAANSQFCRCGREVEERAGQNNFHRDSRCLSVFKFGCNYRLVALRGLRNWEMSFVLISIFDDVSLASLNSIMRTQCRKYESARFVRLRIFISAYLSYAGWLHEYEHTTPVHKCELTNIAVACSRTQFFFRVSFSSLFILFFDCRVTLI